RMRIKLRFDFRSNIFKNIFSYCLSYLALFGRSLLNNKMDHQHSTEDRLMCTLCRVQQQSSDVLKRARHRQITWPKPKQYTTQSPIQDPTVFTTIDDAFSSVLQYMTTTTRQCKRYYKSSPESSKSPGDHTHCNRFHTPEYTALQQRNPLQNSEDVNVIVHPGTYAVTAGSWGTPRQQTHVVRVDQGESVNLDFML
ncbi:unnamed protein product, partial [Owenia fusiformis]